MDVRDLALIGLPAEKKEVDPLAGLPAPSLPTVQLPPVVTAGTWSDPKLDLIHHMHASRSKEIYEQSRLQFTEAMLEALRKENKKIELENKLLRHKLKMRSRTK